MDDMTESMTVHRDEKNAQAERWAGLIAALTRRTGTDPRPGVDRPALCRVVHGITGASLAYVAEYLAEGTWKSAAFVGPDLESAPDIAPGYPSQGRFLVPAWRWAYALLREAAYPVDLQSLAKVLTALTDISQPAAENLLHRAAREGLLDRNRHKVGTRSRTTLWLKEQYR